MLTIEMIYSARERIHPYIIDTPLLRTCGLEYDEPEISAKVYSLLRGMRRKTRYWALRGHTEAEKRVLETPARNDKCPCGSGAKYKKCCAGK